MSDITKFEEFDKYNFDTDDKFQSGLSSLLNKNTQLNNEESEVVRNAKLFYYTKFIDTFNIEEYKNWKKDDKEEEPVEKKEGEEEKPTRFTFQELVDMIEKGIEIPGIKQIPNKLNEGVPSEAKMTARPKPWEINRE